MSGQEEITAWDLPIGTRFIGVHKYQPRGQETWVHEGYQLRKEGTSTCTGTESVRVIKILEDTK